MGEWANFTPSILAFGVAIFARITGIRKIEMEKRKIEGMNRPRWGAWSSKSVGGGEQPASVGSTPIHSRFFIVGPLSFVIGET